MTSIYERIGGQDALIAERPRRAISGASVLPGR
jgi:hypothetical protein